MSAGCPDASAVILAGGVGSRIGRPKATLPFGSATMVEQVAAVLGPAFAEVIVVTSPTLELPSSLLQSRIRVLRDPILYPGPVGALRLGASSATRDLIFACSCDMPLIRRELAALLLSIIGDHDAVVPEIGGRLQPLHAVYRRGRLVRALDQMIAAGEQRLSAIASALDPRIAGEELFRALDPNLESFSNINTQGDYRRLLRGSPP